MLLISFYPLYFSKPEANMLQMWLCCQLLLNLTLIYINIIHFCEEKKNKKGVATPKIHIQGASKNKYC